MRFGDARTRRSIESALELESARAKVQRAEVHWLEAALEEAELRGFIAEAIIYRGQIATAYKRLALIDQDVLALRMELEEFEGALSDSGRQR